MSTDRIRVGIIGLKPGESWASVAHVPALRSMPDRFNIAGVANSRLERAMLAEGFVGRVLSSSMHGCGGNWGPAAGNLARLGYLLDASNGATLLTIPLGHTLAALRDVLGDITEVSALWAGSMLSIVRR